MALGQLVGGQWTTEWQERDEQGRFNRMPTRFHTQITADGSSGYRAEPGRYHLYVSLGCPWAHRTVLMRTLKGLEGVIGLSIVAPVIGEYGWTFSTGPGCIPDTIHGAEHLKDLYVLAEPEYTGRVTVPVLWDKKTDTIVNNESRQIIRMLDTQFEEFSTADIDFYPQALRERIDQTIDAIYWPINNGVYRTGFATSQVAYEEAFFELFSALDYWERVLGEQHYLCGTQITEADWCLFPTLLRFDLAYYGLFKCNLRRLVDYPNLWNYLNDLYRQPGVKAVCDIDHIKRLYYNITQLNPTRIVPIGPRLHLGG
ncbi:MAG: glutathione S-transferase family protein [Gemmatimonadaceae bacterium]|nr:glutathione S-transferase family protein [Gloeobacterales cyanobacterium ES-bin-141]